jgi:DNA modification methylase
MINPYYSGERFTLYTGDTIEVLSELPSRCVHCVVTSPPYWGLRDYGTGTWTGGHPTCRHSTGRGSNTPHTKNPTLNYPASPAHRGGDPRTCRRCGAVREDRQYGLEATPEDYVTSLRAVFAHLHRVLADTGTVWLNLGDCYSTQPPTPSTDRAPTLPRKNLLGMPWRVALALQQDRWILRNAIVWHKPNAMPESVRDRLSRRYEMLFLLVKQPHYWFNLDPIRESPTHPTTPSTTHKTPHTKTRTRHHPDSACGKYANTTAFGRGPHGSAIRPGHKHTATHPQGRNPGDIWSINTRPLRAAHFAAFPIDIPLRAITAGCPPGGTVLDPFSGAGTTGLAAHHLAHPYIGIDLNPTFHDITLTRLATQTTQHEPASQGKTG